MKPAPFRIEPTFHPRIWGERSLAPIFPDKTGLKEPIGEVWLTDVQCNVGNGAWAGESLGETWRQLPAEWRGPRCESMADFPLLVKFVFPSDKLSIQVHPDDEYAKLHEAAAGGRGKTEMWHIVSAQPGAQLLLGLKDGVSKQEFSASVKSRELEKLFRTHMTQAGETFFVAPGTPHSIGPGMMICEVQQYCDLTYRVYDYDRTGSDGKPRQLHLEKALEVIKFGAPAPGAVPPLQWSSQKMGISLLAACRYFATERWRLGETLTARPKTDAFNLLVFLSGHGVMRWSGGKNKYHAGECWFIPAALKSYELLPKGESEIIRTFVPDLDALRTNLRALGASDAKICQVVFE